MQVIWIEKFIYMWVHCGTTMRKLLIFTVIIVLLAYSTVGMELHYKMPDWDIKPSMNQKAQCQAISETMQKIDTQHLVSSIICDFREVKVVSRFPLETTTLSSSFRTTKNCGYSWWNNRQIMLVMNSPRCNLISTAIHELGHKACNKYHNDKTEDCASAYWPESINSWSDSWNATAQAWSWSIS